MDYLTVKEVAELKSCSIRNIQQCCRTGKIEGIQKLNTKNKISFLIPITVLPDELQQRYYKKQHSEAGLLPEVTEEKKTAAKKQRSFEELSADERAEVNVWTDILKEWQGLRNGYNGSKVEFDKLYVGKCQLEHPDIKISKDILYRKWSAYRNNDIEGLIDKREELGTEATARYPLRCGNTSCGAGSMKANLQQAFVTGIPLTGQRSSSRSL